MGKFNVGVIAVILTCTFYLQSYSQQSKLIRIFTLSIPEQQGLSSSTLDSLLLFVRNTNQNIHHLTIIRNHHTVLDADFYPYSSQYLHDVASVTKSFTSLLIGIAIDKGFIKDENESVLQFFPEASPRESFPRAAAVW